MRYALLYLIAAAPLLNATTYYVTIAGLGGTPEFDTQFSKWAAETDRALHASDPSAHVTTLSGAQATRSHIQSELARLASDIKPDDAFALMLIGHGTYDDTDYKFNLPGPDITGAELASLLDRIPTKHQLVVNMTSASGASLAALANKNRIVITATKSGNEKNVTLFARYWIEALRDPEADTNKNGVVSALEAYRYTERKTAQFYESEKRIATEHAMLDDNGANDGARDPSPANGEGMQAASFAVVRFGASQSVALTPAKQQLLHKKEDLEAQIDRLKYQKAALPDDEYKKQLTSLLLDLARTQAELDK